MSGRRLAGSSVMVVGGSSGIGLATARRALAEGARVLITGRDGARLVAAADALPSPVDRFQLDARDPDRVAALFAAYPDVHHVAVLAGEQPVGRVVDGDLDYFHRAMAARFWAALHVARYAAPRLPAGGSLTLCSGVVAHRPQPTRALGTASTAAVEALGRALAKELAPVRVNTIVPGPIDTPMLHRYLGERRDRALADLATRLPVGRVGTADDVADVIVFLMGNGFVTGVTLPVDGGLLLT